MARRRRRGGSAPKQAAGVAILAVCFAIMAGLGWLFLHLKEQQARFDPETFCPLDGRHDRTAILIDASDPLSATQVKRVREHIEDLRLHLELHEWVGLYVLGEDNLVLPRPVFALCNPGNAEQANPLYENPDRIRRQFAERFQAPMVEAVERLAEENTEEQSTSPILEMVRAVATDRGYRSSGRRRLVIVSDMLQNTPQYSHYSGEPDFGAFRESGYAGDFLNLSLLDVDVEILYLKRTKTAALQTYGHVRFWEQYFDAVDASLGRVEPVL